MGPIVDRSRETLGTTDAAVIATRRILLGRLKNEPGDDPPGVAPTYYTVRAIERVVGEDVDWRTALKDLYLRPAEG